MKFFFGVFIFVSNVIIIFFWFKYFVFKFFVREKYWFGLLIGMFSAIFLFFLYWVDANVSFFLLKKTGEYTKGAMLDLLLCSIIPSLYTSIYWAIKLNREK